MQSQETGNVVKFTGLTTATIVKIGVGDIGFSSDNFQPHTDTDWTPCEDPEEEMLQTLLEIERQYGYSIIATKNY